MSTSLTEVAKDLLTSNTSNSMDSFPALIEANNLLASAELDSQIDFDKGCYTYNREARTLLEIAVDKKNTQAVTMMCQAGADPNSTTSIQYSPLWRAVNSGNIEMVETLLAFGASPEHIIKNRSDENLKTPLCAATNNYSKEILSLLLLCDNKQQSFKGFKDYEHIVASNNHFHHACTATDDGERRRAINSAFNANQLFATQFIERLTKAVVNQSQGNAYDSAFFHPETLKIALEELHKKYKECSVKKADKLSTINTDIVEHLLAYNHNNDPMHIKSEKLNKFITSIARDTEYNEIINGMRELGKINELHKRYGLPLNIIQDDSCTDKKKYSISKDESTIETPRTKVIKEETLTSSLISILQAEEFSLEKFKIILSADKILRDNHLTSACLYNGQLTPSQTQALSIPANSSLLTLAISANKVQAIQPLVLLDKSFNDSNHWIGQDSRAKYLAYAVNKDIPQGSMSGVIEQLLMAGAKPYHADNTHGITDAIRTAIFWDNTQTLSLLLRYYDKYYDLPDNKQVACHNCLVKARDEKSMQTKQSLVGEALSYDRMHTLTMMAYCARALDSNNHAQEVNFLFESPQLFSACLQRLHTDLKDGGKIDKHEVPMIESIIEHLSHAQEPEKKLDLSRDKLDKILEKFTNSCSQNQQQKTQESNAKLISKHSPLFSNSGDAREEKYTHSPGSTNGGCVIS
jgi:uncharacterized coiled-coil protein SlyX